MHGGVRQFVLHWIFRLVVYDEDLSILSQFEEVSTQLCPWCKRYVMGLERFFLLTTAMCLTTLTRFDELADVVSDVWLVNRVTGQTSCNLNSQVTDVKLIEHIMPHRVRYDDLPAFEENT